MRTFLGKRDLLLRKRDLLWRKRDLLLTERGLPVHLGDRGLLVKETETYQ